MAFDFQSFLKDINKGDLLDFNSTGTCKYWRFTYKTLSQNYEYHGTIPTLKKLRN